jgi:hypothetical protein
MMNNRIKMRVWWQPQVGYGTFYIPVNSPEEAAKILNLLAAYDLFQLKNNIKPDYCNAGGVQIFDEEENDWVNWEYETEDDYYDDVEKYCEDVSPEANRISDFKAAVLGQVHFD